MKILLSQIYAKASSRPAGYVEDVLSKSEVVGDSIEISVENLRELRHKYDPQPAVSHGEGCQQCRKLKDE